MCPGLAEQVELFAFLALAIGRDDRGKVRKMKHFTRIIESKFPRPVQQRADQVGVVILGDVRGEVRPGSPRLGQERFDGGHRVRMIPEVSRS